MSIEERLGSLIGSTPRGLNEGVALGTGLADGYDLYESALGRVAVTFNPEGVSSLEMAEVGFEERLAGRLGRGLIRAEPPAAWGRHIPDAIEAGTPGKVPVDLRAVTPFQESVLRITAGIPRGEVRPYSWLAREASRPGAVRAAGSAVANNPIPLIIPCHRVIRADGHLGNYSLGGPRNKIDLLEHEGANPQRLEQLAGRHVRYMGNTTTGIYCHPTCKAVRRSKPGNVTEFRSVDQASTAGYRPCKVCRPV